MKHSNDREEAKPNQLRVYPFPQQSNRRVALRSVVARAKWPLNSTGCPAGHVCRAALAEAPDPTISAPGNRADQRLSDDGETWIAVIKSFSFPQVERLRLALNPIQGFQQFRRRFEDRPAMVPVPRLADPVRIVECDQSRDQMMRSS